MSLTSIKYAQLVLLVLLLGACSETCKISQPELVKIEPSLDEIDLSTSNSVVINVVVKNESDNLVILREGWSSLFVPYYYLEKMKYKRTYTEKKYYRLMCWSV